MDSSIKKHLRATPEIYVCECGPFRHSKKYIMFFEIVNGCDVRGFCSKDLSSSLVTS